MAIGSRLIGEGDVVAWFHLESQPIDAWKDGSIGNVQGVPSESRGRCGRLRQKLKRSPAAWS